MNGIRWNQKYFLIKHISHGFNLVFNDMESIETKGMKYLWHSSEVISFLFCNCPLIFCICWTFSVKIWKFPRLITFSTHILNAFFNEYFCYFRFNWIFSVEQIVSKKIQVQFEGFFFWIKFTYVNELNRIFRIQKQFDTLYPEEL